MNQDYTYRRKIMNGKPVVLGFLIAGILLLSISGYLYYDTRSWLGRSISVDAIVVDNDSTVDIEGDFMYTPIVTYIDHRGIERTFRSSLSSNYQQFNIGEKISVLYDPDDSNYHENVKINGFMQLWFVPLVLSILGGFSIFLSYFVRRMKRDKGTKL